MRVPFEWLREFVQCDGTPDEVSRILTMIGHEVEGTEDVDGDVVFEVNITPNRPDCLSILGIARELAAALGKPVRLPDLTVVSEPRGLDFNLDILDSDLCPRYAGRIVRNIAIGPSPEWMRRRIEKCGIRSINNIVDVTNYVLIEMGHPLHAFDLAALRKNRIRVGTPASVQGKGVAVSMQTLDGVSREIPPQSLLIWDGERPVAVAGVMGGLDTEVKESTRDVFIESAYFDPVSVRRTSKALGLRTESSYRFERGTDIKLLKKALDRAARLTAQVSGGRIDGKIDLYPRLYAPPSVRVHYGKVRRVLGVGLSDEEILRTLDGLGLTIDARSDHFAVTPPTYRRDILRDADVIEEVARMYGYDRIPAKMPKVEAAAPEVSRSARRDANPIVKEAFLKSGFTEVINFSFMGTADLDLLGIAEDDGRRSAVVVKNPLRVEDSLMRTTLIPSLLRNVATNIAHGIREMRLFEAARVFIQDPGLKSTRGAGDDPLPVEDLHAGLVLYREKTQSLYPDDTPDFFVVKGVIENMLRELAVRGISFRRSDEPFLHPGQSADILVGGEKAGCIGVLSPVVVDALGIKAQRPSFVVAEVNISMLGATQPDTVTYRPLPRYPAIERDTAVVVDAGLEAAHILSWIDALGEPLVEERTLFDVYQGDRVAAGSKSIAFRVTYRAYDRTLTDEEIDGIHQKLVAHVLTRSGGQIRQ